MGLEGAGHGADLGDRGRPDEGRSVDGVVGGELDTESAQDRIKRLESTSHSADDGRDETRLSHRSGRDAGGQDCRSNDRRETHSEML